MVNFYVARILAGRMTVEQVPARWREAVRARLEPEPDVSYQSMNKTELLALCEERGIEAYESWTKQQIIDALVAAEGAE